MNERIALRQTCEQTCGLVERLYKARAEVAHEMTQPLESMHQAGVLMSEIHRLMVEQDKLFKPPAT